jgi:predicted nucleic acid-binding protein
MTVVLALDASVAVRLLVGTHPQRDRVVGWLAGRRCAPAGHALAETYSVLTRLPGDIRVAPATAARLLAQFEAPIVLGPDRATGVVAVLAEAGISGGAVHDGLVALAAVEHGALLATRDARARSTYEALGAKVVIVS